jgi:outer membrane lipoprotein SlyB
MTTRLVLAETPFEKYECANRTTSTFEQLFVEATGTTSTTSATSSVALYTGGTALAEDEESNVGAIAGGTVGGIAALAVIGGIVGYLAWKKKKAAKKETSVQIETSQYDRW